MAGKIKIFLGAYINCTNAQNLNCLALAKHLDKEKFEVYTLELYSGDLPNSIIKGVNIFQCFYPHKISIYLAYLWGIWNCNVAYLPKGELPKWNRFWVRFLKKKKFTTIEGIFDDQALKNAILNHGSKKALLAHFNSFENRYSITRFMQNYNFENLKIKSSSRILYLGTDIQTFLNEYKNVKELHNIILIGNDLVRKGIFDYIELAKEFQDLTFHVVGTGNGKIDVNEEIKTRGLSNIKNHGGLKHAELVALLKQMDLHILPSLSEGFPKVTLETAAAGVASLVYSDYGAAEWISHKECGFVVDTLTQMKQIIKELQENPDLLQEASKGAFQMAKRFDWKIMIKDWEEEIERILKE